MKETRAQNTVQRILSGSDVRVGGDRPWDIQVHDPRFYERVLSGGSLALGESYMDGWWDCEALDQFFGRILESRLDETVRVGAVLLLWSWIRTRLFNAQRKSKAYVVGERHYDVGNDLFSLMLDKGLNYSCGYWARARTLDEAQEAKLDLICRKLGLEAGMSVLDIGCGWGGFAKHAARRYGVRVHGITVSQEQVTFARESCSGLDITIELKDYRQLTGTYDRVVSIGMFEHVGYKNYRTFMETVDRCLNAEGLFLLHTIAGNMSARSMDPWSNKYIFPNSMLPSARQIAAAAEGLFVLEHWQGFGQYYDTTLMAWYDNFTRNWPKLKSAYDERFYRMWTFYLLSSAGGFRARRNQLWQIVFSRNGIPGGFTFTE